jgi:hypothetical protein
MIALTGFRPAPDGRSATVVVQSATDHLPALGVAVYKRRGSKWKRVSFTPLDRTRSLKAGERAELAIAWPEAALDARRDARNLALGIESDVEWFPGRLPVLGADRNAVSFADLLQRWK